MALHGRMQGRGFAEREEEDEGGLPDASGVVGSAITVKNTFIHLEGSRSLSVHSRRARSAPPCEMAAWLE